MRSGKILSVLILSLSALYAIDVLAQSDLYNRINPLESALKSNSATRDQQVELAHLYLQAGRYYEASQIAGRLLALNAADAEAFRIRDEAASHLRAVATQRVADAERAARAQGATDQDRLTLADAYFGAGRYADALDAYGALPENMRTRDVRIRQARALAWSGHLDDAERSYSVLLKEDASPDLQLEYGRLLSWMGASKAAVARLQTLYDQTPSEDNATALANAEALAGNREGAIRFLTDYTSSHTTAVQAAALLADLRASPDLRIEHINRLIEAEPYNLALRVERARLNLDRGHYNESLSDVRFVREHSKQNIEGLDDVAAQAEERRTAELKALQPRLDALKNTNPANADEVLSLAKAYVGLGDYDSAIALYEQYLKIRPDDTDARIQYARVLSWDRRYPAAERQYEKLIAQYPDRADLKLEYGQTLSYDAQFADALHMFSSLTDLNANPRRELYSDVPSRAYFNRGQIYRWFGWTDHDVLDQNMALSMDSGYAAAQQELDLARHTKPTSTLDARYTYVTDSNDFTMKRADLDAAKWTSGRTAFQLGVGRHEFEHAGDDVYANALSAGALYRYNDNLLVRGRVGANFYDHSLGTRPFWGLGGEWMPNLQSRAAIDYNRYDLIYDVFTIQSLQTPTLSNFTRPISIDDFRGHYDYNTGGHFAYLADASYGFVSDDNRRAAAHGVVSYRILKAPFLAVKGDGRWLSYDFRTNRYWSPSDYRSVAGVVQVGQNLHDRFLWNAEVKYGRSWEGSRSSDLRAYDLTATVPISDAFDIVGNYGYGRSGRLDSILGNRSSDLVNYWQRHFYVGIRVKRLFANDDRHAVNPYYFDNTVLTGSPVVPETH